MGLFKPAWQIRNYEKRLQAVKKLTNQKELSEVVNKEITDNTVRSEALRKLTDQTLLAGVSLNAIDKRARWAAYAKLTDPGMLAVVAKNSDIVDMRVNATEKLDDQDVLAEFAIHDKEKVVQGKTVRVY